VLCEILREVHSDVSGGESLADAMLKHPNAFNELAVAMVRAGEEGGFLEDVLARIAYFVERQDELRNKVVGSMIYPVILLFVGVTVVAALMVFVIPQIRPILDRVENKPWMTDLLFAMCDMLVYGWPFILGGIIALVVGASAVLRSESGRHAWDRFKMRVPVSGKIVQMVSICRFCRILGTMLRNGVPILQALRISRDSAGNVVLAEQIDAAAENVQKGETLAVPLGSGDLFPGNIVDMIAVAEESNNLENVLVQIAESNEARTARMIDLGVRLLEPLMLLVMAAMVLFIAVALLVPILNMSSAV
jgi:general secretion pathway protein F/type IV pilus assembly protein PilC